MNLERANFLTNDDCKLIAQSVCSRILDFRLSNQNDDISDYEHKLRAHFEMDSELRRGRDFVYGKLSKNEFNAAIVGCEIREAL